MERPVSTRRLTILYIIALSLIGLLTITGQVVVQISLWQLTGDATVVNLAGRQRMISQRLAKLILAAAVNSSPERRVTYSRDLEASLSQWEIAQRGLRFGETSLQLVGNNSPIVNEMLKALQPDFDATCQHVRDVIELLQADARNVTLRPDLESKAALIMDTTERFLTGMDAIVAQYEHEAQRRVVQLQRTERGLLIATLLVLLAEGCLVFYPAVDSIRRNLLSLSRLTEELSQAKQLADDANRAKSQFLARMSHELRTPLHAVLGLLSIAYPHVHTRRVRCWLSTARSSATMLKELLDDLLDLSSIEAGNSFAIEERNVHLAKLLKHCVRALRGIAKQKGLNIQLELNENVPQFILADPHRLKQIVYNLVQNAIRYTEHGQIIIRVKTAISRSDVTDSPVDQLIMEVIDTGKGMSIEEQSHLIERLGMHPGTELSLNEFATGNDASRDLFGARLGLGLTITAGLIRAMQGWLEIDSEQHKGSCFRVLLPLKLCDSMSGEPVEPATARQTVRPFKKRALRKTSSPRLCEPTSQPPILVVDDDASSRYVMKFFLDEIGFQAITCNSGAVACDLASQHAFVACLLDQRLPDIDGIDLSRRLEKIFGPSVPVFMITADNPEILRQQIDDGPIRKVLGKPISLETLQSALAGEGVSSPADIMRPHDERSTGANPSTCSRATKADTVSVNAGESPRNHVQLREQLRQLFEQNFPAQMNLLRLAIERARYEDALLILHRIRGSAAQADLHEIAHMAKTMEAYLREPDPESKQLAAFLDRLSGEKE